MRPSEALEKHREAVLAAIGRYPLAEPRLFGSTARGEDDEQSDLDILVRTTGPIGYMALARLELELARLTGVKVDLKTEAEFGESSARRVRAELRTI